jgi:hypothetical protein
LFPTGAAEAPVFLPCGAILVLPIAGTVLDRAGVLTHLASAAIFRWHDAAALA